MLVGTPFGRYGFAASISSTMAAVGTTTAAAAPPPRPSPGGGARGTSPGAGRVGLQLRGELLCLRGLRVRPLLELLRYHMKVDAD